MKFFWSRISEWAPHARCGSTCARTGAAGKSRTAGKWIECVQLYYRNLFLMYGPVMCVLRCDVWCFCVVDSPSSSSSPLFVYLWGRIRSPGVHTQRTFLLRLPLLLRLGAFFTVVRACVARWPTANIDEVSMRHHTRAEHLHAVFSCLCCVFLKIVQHIAQ